MPTRVRSPTCTPGRWSTAPRPATFRCPPGTPRTTRSRWRSGWPASRAERRAGSDGYPGGRAQGEQGDLRRGAHPDRRTPEPDASGDVEPGAADPGQPGEHRLVEQHQVAERQELPAVGVTGYLQVHAPAGGLV